MGIASGRDEELGHRPWGHSMPPRHPITSCQKKKNSDTTARPRGSKQGLVGDGLPGEQGSHPCQSCLPFQPQLCDHGGILLKIKGSTAGHKTPWNLKTIG